MKTITVNSKKHGTKHILVDDEDYDFLMQWKWYIHQPNTSATYYAINSGKKINGKQEQVKMHRLLLNLKKGDNLQVDHIDHNGLNNQKSNLRSCTKQDNNKNSVGWGKSKYIGVCWHTRDKTWCVGIAVNGKRKHVGYFDDEMEAALARDAAAKAEYGEFANLNFKENEKTG